MERKSKINNSFYDSLGEMWYQGDSHPIALLRAESQTTIPWVMSQIENLFHKKKCQILDIACGGGYLANSLAKDGHEVTGIDLSEKSLEIARKFDATKSVKYVTANACSLPLDNQSFDVVSAMDFLEHTEQKEQVIREASRVLKKGGLFLFHTFNRNIMSYLLVIKGVEWSIKNSPPHLHTYDLFIKPKELKDLCHKEGLKVQNLSGMSPNIKTKAFWKMLLTRRVPSTFSFKLTSSLKLGYLGSAQK